MMMYFGYEGGYEVYRESPVRIIVDENDTPLFCGFDVAKLLKYKNPSVAVFDNCPSRRMVEFSDGTRFHRLRFVSKEDVMKLARRRSSDAEHFLNDIINGKTPSAEVKKSTTEQTAREISRT